MWGGVVWWYDDYIWIKDFGWTERHLQAQDHAHKGRCRANRSYHWPTLKGRQYHPHSDMSAVPCRGSNREDKAICALVRSSGKSCCIFIDHLRKNNIEPMYCNANQDIDHQIILFQTQRKVNVLSHVGHETHTQTNICPWGVLVHEEWRPDGKEPSVILLECCH